MIFAVSVSSVSSCVASHLRQVLVAGNEVIFKMARKRLERFGVVAAAVKSPSPLVSMTKYRMATDLEPKLRITKL